MQTRLRLTATALLFLLLLSGCAVTGTSFRWADVDRIQPGMSAEQLTEVLGAPTSASTEGERETWTWTQEATGPLALFAEKAVSVDLQDGRVVSDPKTADELFHQEAPCQMR